MQSTGEEIASLPLEREAVLRDYHLVYLSRQVSLVGRREVMSGKAKFGIFGDGKEVAQIALARVFEHGDFRSGYYRDQTLILALDLVTVSQFFSQLYADTEPGVEIHSGGRQMNAHFASRSLNADGSWRNLTQQFNTAADMSPTAGQMPRLVGLGYASKLYRKLPAVPGFDHFSQNGSEIAFGTIGNASCAEGHFWEAVNAFGVLQIPVVLSIWDDGYGISVPNEYQITKSDISRTLAGFQDEGAELEGIDLYRVVGWDYPALVSAYQQAAKNARDLHRPAIIHVADMTQPQGHSSSGSHERYKSEERLEWEQAYDCLPRFRQWILEQGFASDAELEQQEARIEAEVETQRKLAWDNYRTAIRQTVQEFADVLDELPLTQADRDLINPDRDRLLSRPNPLRQDVARAAQAILLKLRQAPEEVRRLLVEWRHQLHVTMAHRYGDHLYSGKKIEAVAATFSEDAVLLPGYQIIRQGFEAIIERDPRAVAFGEDVGKLGDVNQGMAGLQEKFGELRITDTGIRETTIVGQAIGMALRGLRPIAEIQYVDYLLYGLQTLSDDLATTRWRSAGGQQAPVIIRTRGHRLEGVWHSGSPMGLAIAALQGLIIAVPRNMVQAVGFYNALLKGDDPGLVIEVLNGYRLREQVPDNLGEYTLVPGEVEILRSGGDLTIVTYGASCKIALAAAEQLAEIGIELEVIDVQTLLPFDTAATIASSLQKTNRVLFLDEDVPGGGTGHLMHQVLEVQNGFQWLDSAPKVLCGKPHRPAYGSDGNYWSKPNLELVFETVYLMMHELDPDAYPNFL
jgi:pyruvate/2-oxoglutarate/acetoin dehydrogenase E1 component/TPP-dependent pyruvate/acetoin dehydrogenase alpha subunit